MAANTKTSTPDLVLAQSIAAAQTAINKVIADSAVPEAVKKDNIKEFADLVNGMIADLQSAKAPFAKQIRVASSMASRAKQKARVAEALALLAEKEAAETAE